MLAPVGPVLAEGHDVDVVVDQHRHPVAVREAARDREPVPAGHDRRVAWQAGRGSTGPGTPTPMPVTWSRPAPTSANRASKRSSTSREPLRDRVRSRCPRGSRRGPTPQVRDRDSGVDAPRSAARTRPASSLKAKRIGGRPPVDWLPPASRRRPSSCSCSRRWAIVERARPVCSARSAWSSRHRP